MKLSKKELAEHRKEKHRLKYYLNPKSKGYVTALGELWKKELGHYFGQRTEFRKQKLFELLKNGMDKPKTGDKWGRCFKYWTNPNRPDSDPEWTAKVKTIRPDLFLTAKQKSYEKMLKMMPKTVTFKEGQVWKGTHVKHVFIDERYGEFETMPYLLICRTWATGRSGHPKEGHEAMVKANSKPVRKVETGEVYASGKEAGKAHKSGASDVWAAIKRGTKCAGFHWELVK